MIEVFDDRVNTTNPGGLPSGLNDATFGTMSVPRNPLISALLLRAGYIEKIGTGINRIKDAVNMHGGKVVFTYDTNHFMVSFMRRQNTERSTVQPAVQYAVQLAVQILEAIQNNPKITTKQIAMELGVALRTVEKHIATLKQNGKLKRFGPNKTGEWIVVTKQ